MRIKRDATDAAFSDAVRERDNWTCQSCGLIDPNGQMTGKSMIMDCSHVKSRSSNNTRWYPDNALCICKSCHSKLGKDPIAHAALIRGILGDTRHNMLTERINNTKIKYYKNDKRNMARHFREETRRIRKLREEGYQGRIDLVSFD